MSVFKRLPVMISAALPVVVSTPASSTPSSKDAPHHLPNGTFKNPWESYIQVNPFSPFTLYQMFKEWTSRPVSLSFRVFSSQSNTKTNSFLFIIQFDLGSTT